MKYNGFYFGFYFWMFKSPMKKVLAEKYGREYAADIMKKSKKLYRELVEKADDIGDDNPMAYNELFALLQKKRGMVRSVDVARHMEVSKPSVCHVGY